MTVYLVGKVPEHTEPLVHTERSKGKGGSSSDEAGGWHVEEGEEEADVGEEGQVWQEGNAEEGQGRSGEEGQEGNVGEEGNMEVGSHEQEEEGGCE